MGGGVHNSRVPLFIEIAKCYIRTSDCDKPTELRVEF